MHEIEAGRRWLRSISFGFGVPDLLDLEQSTVTPAHVVLAELQRGTPTSALEFAAIGLCEDGTVLALAKQPLARCGKDSGDHGTHLERTTLWSVSPDCL